jgi:interferon-induced GTP-binding protein Mx1
MNSFTNAYDEKVRPLMDKIDQVRSILSSNDDGITFPSVVVVGDQSSGKSTLLEALSMVELPKGSGIVTRCPLVLRLRKSMQRQVYHLQADNQKVPLDESKVDILKYIEQETKKLAGDHKNVVHDLIELLVEDPNVRDLTVVDLPGIARNPIADQPKDIYKQTTGLIRKFISQAGSVILCVFPANMDVATVESFTLAGEVDVFGVRTIGVITKSDLAPNSDVLVQQLLMEKADVLKLTLGFVAVRNRSTDEKLTLEEARRREREFFQQHPASSTVGWYCLGINALINRLADLYSDRVKETFPKMRQDIQKKLKDVREQLSKFPPDLETPSARLAKYYELADFYVENILKVRFSSSSDGQHASVVNILHEKFLQVEKIISNLTRDLFSSKYRSKVRSAMTACFGEQLPNFLPHPVLKRLVCEKLDQFWQVIDILINECFHMTNRLLVDKDVDACEGDILLNKLLPAFRNIAVLYLNEKYRIVREQLQELIRLEKHDPYTTNHYYMDTINKFKAHLEEQYSTATVKQPSSTSLSEVDDEPLFDSISNDEQAVQEMLISIYSYWKVLTKRFMDYAALSLRAGCVFDVCPGIRERLRRIPTEECDFVDSYLAEDVYIRTKRKQLQQTKERLEKVDAILGGQSVTDAGNNIFTDTMTVENGSLMTLDALEKSLSQTTVDDGMSSISIKSISNLTTAVVNTGVSRAAEPPPPPMTENFERFFSRRRRDPNSSQPPPPLP